MAPARWSIKYTKLIQAGCSIIFIWLFWEVLVTYKWDHSHHGKTYKLANSVPKFGLPVSALASSLSSDGGHGHVLQSQQHVGKPALKPRTSVVITKYSHTNTKACLSQICADINEGHSAVVMAPTPRATCSDVSTCITVTVKTKHRLDQVATLISSLHEFYPNTKVIVADEFYPDYSSKAPLKWKQEYLKGTPEVVTYFQTRPGVGYGRHLAAKLATSKYILVADDDYVFTNKTKLDLLLSILENTDISIAGGAVDDNYPFDGALRVWQPNNHTSHIVFYPGVFHETLYTFGDCYVSDVIKNFFLADRKAILDANDWDVLRLFYEHEDFFFQMRKNRLKVSHCRDVVIRHDTKDRRLAEERKKHFKRWSDSLKKKWGFDDYYYCDKNQYMKSDSCKRKSNFA